MKPTPLLRPGSPGSPAKRPGTCSAWFSAVPTSARTSARTPMTLAESGREADAAAVLRVLGGSAGYSEGALLLGHLAEGLERHGHEGLAAQAYTLAWTRARGGGGWLNFGGQTALDALQNATRLAP